MSNNQNPTWAYPPPPPNTGQPPQPPPPQPNNPNQQQNQPNTPQQPYLQQQPAAPVGAQPQPHDPNQQQPANGHPDRLPSVAQQQAMHQGPPLQPMHPDYRLPMPQQMYGHPYAQPHQGYPPQQPAPRQRTAIACRYCRRRKIRCSGFEHSEDGRCTNCQRFSQECVFTPVSAQTQAFVPAHTVWRGGNAPPNAQLYGAYGQPLPPQAGRDPYQQQQQQVPAPQPGQQQQAGQYPPPPPGYQQQPMYAPVPQEAGRKRGTDEPHTPTLPPPNPGPQSQFTDPQANGDPERQGSNRNSRMVDVGVQVEIIGGQGS